MPHTPGPWQQHDHDYCPFEIWGALDGPLEDGKIHGEQVCDIIEGDDAERNHANARLIAAAPELLSACEVLHVRLFAEQNGDPDSKWASALAVLSRVIRKATGK